MPLPCDADAFDAGGGLASQAGCGMCPVGSFCTSGCVYPEQCPAGRYGSRSSQIDA